MRQFWTLFVVGLFSAAVISTVLRDSRASGGSDERVKRIEDPDVSGLKTEVPLVSEMEAGMSEKEIELKEKERRLKEMEERMKVEEARVTEKIDRLQILLEDLEKKRKENKDFSDKTLQRLVKTYESMNPKKAAGVLSVMEDPLAVELLMTMKEKKVAQILDAMDPNRAMTLSSLVAKRRPAGQATSQEQLPSEEKEASP